MTPREKGAAGEESVGRLWKLLAGRFDIINSRGERALMGGKQKLFSQRPREGKIPTCRGKTTEENADEEKPPSLMTERGKKKPSC